MPEHPQEPSGLEVRLSRTVLEDLARSYVQQQGYYVTAFSWEGDYLHVFMTSPRRREYADPE